MYLSQKIVQGFTTLDGGKHCQELVRNLKRITDVDGSVAYNVQHRILNTKDHGLPQNRPRWYCVGIRRKVHSSAFRFPDAIASVPLKDILDATLPKADKAKMGQVALQNIAAVNKHLTLKGHDPHKELFVVDCDSSVGKATHSNLHSPCLTRSRYKGHWITAYERRMTLHEMAKLQGIDISKLDSPSTSAQLGQQIGDAMSMNVIERLITRALASTNLNVHMPAGDRWESGEAQRELFGSSIALPQSRKRIQ